MKTVCRVLEVARSHIHDLHRRSDDWKEARKARTPVGDAQLLTEICEQIAGLPSYGYWRTCALVNRQWATHDGMRVNPKRAHRVMAQNRLLLPKPPHRRQSTRVHDGKVAVQRSELRWCSVGLKIKCDSGQMVTATFAKDCCDCEVMAWRTWEGKGLPGESVREMLIEAVKKRFGTVEAVPVDHRLEFLTYNGGDHIAADTRAMARSLGLVPVNTQMCSPQSSGIAESFVYTFKHDYVARMDLRDATRVMAQLSVAFEHFNEVHPHSPLKMRSPREFRRHQAAQARQPSVKDLALNCE